MSCLLSSKDVDFTLLAEQKADLVRVRDVHIADPYTAQSLGGIIHLIDAIQDEAEALGLDPYGET
jgi:hypothetical protein